MGDLASNSKLARLFIKEGELVEVPSNQRIFLLGESKLFWIEDGNLDIFALASKESLKTTPFFLINVQKDRCLFPFPQDANIQVFGLANSFVKLRALSIDRIQSYLLNNIEAKTAFFSDMGSWINALQSIFNKYHLYSINSHLQENAPTTLQKGETLVIPHYKYIEEKNSIPWVRILKGEVNVLNIESIILTAGENIYPLSPSEWLKANVNETQIEIFNEEYNTDNYDRFWQGFLSFQRIIIQVISHDISQQNLKDQETSSIKIEKENESLDLALRELGSVLNLNEISAESPSSQPLIRACQLVGHAIQQTFVEPSSTKAKNVTERIYEIAVASDAHYRQVLLTPNWWNQDNGPLLGFIADKHVKPLALLTNIPGKYRMANPEKGEIQSVDARTAQSIDSKAMMFYRAFPKKAILLGKDILNFCLHGRIRDYWTILLFGFLGILVSLFLPISNQLIFDEVIPYLDKTSFFYIFIALIAMFASMSLFSITREYAILRAETYLNHDVEVALWERMLKLPTQFFRRYTIGNLILRIFSVKELRRMISGQVIRIALSTVFSLVFLIVMIYYSPILTLVGVGIVSIGLIISTIGFLFSQKLELANQEIKGQINGKVLQMIYGLSKIRTNGAENRIFASWVKDMIQSQRLNLRIGTATNVVKVTNNTLDLLKFLIIFIVILHLMQTKNSMGEVFALSIGSYLAFNAAFATFSSNISEFSSVMMEMIGVYPLWMRSKVILNEPIESSADKVSPEVLKGDLRIEHLSFRYDRSSAPVINNLSLNASPGEFIGIVGPSGCGKSTLIRLLVGFETPEQGAIFYDGKDLATLDLRAVRSQMGTILQNSMIIDGTIYDNIAMGNLATEEEVLAAAKMAGLMGDLNELPMGLRTYLTAGGPILSGGQRQRVLLARAFLAKPSIMFWDEATNALDNQSQDGIIKNLEKLDITRIVVAHRFSTIQHADRIYVMDRGKIIDTGTYKELSSRPGLFTDMLSLQ